jgi:DNA-binding transcriptional LysR family regulator
MRMDLEHLRTFLLVAEGGSFTGAAEGAGRTQPTVSRQVRALEAALGTRLFLRAGRSAVLTDAGRQLVGYARRLLALADEAGAAVSAEGRQAAGRLRVGAGGLASQYLLPPLLEAVRAGRPDLRLVVAAHHPDTIAEQVATGDLDVGLVTRPVRRAGLAVADAGEDEMVAIVAPGHPWARRPERRLPPAAFDGEPFILYDRGTGTSRRILGYFARQGVRLRIGMEVRYVEAMKEMVRIGLGVSLVPAWVATREAAAGQIAAVRLAGPGFRRRWAVIHASRADETAPVAAFVAGCRERLPRMLAGPFARRGA